MVLVPLLSTWSEHPLPGAAICLKQDQRDRCEFCSTDALAIPKDVEEQQMETSVAVDRQDTTQPC